MKKILAGVLLLLAVSPAFGAVYVDSNFNDGTTQGFAPFWHAATAVSCRELNVSWVTDPYLPTYPGSYAWYVGSDSVADLLPADKVTKVDMRIDATSTTYPYVVVYPSFWNEVTFIGVALTDDSGGNLLRVWVYEGGTQLDNYLTAHPVVVGTTYSLEIVQSGDNIKVYVDSVLVFDQTDTDFGDVAAVASKLAVGGVYTDQVAFDNVVVEDLPVPCPEDLSDELAACQSDLTGAQAALSACQGDLSTCTSSLTASQSALSACTTDLAASQSALTGCQGDLEGCEGKLDKLPPGIRKQVESGTGGIGTPRGQKSGF